jgi:putative membrane protein
MNLSKLNTYLAAALFGGMLALPAVSHAADDQQSSPAGQQSAQPGGESSQPGTRPQPGGQPAQAKLSSSDRKFLMEAAQGGLLEVEAGRLAAARAGSDEVRQFAQQLVKDHSDANEKLMQIAQDKGVQLPKQLDAKHKQQLDKLSKLKGEEFDRAYLAQIGHKDHQKDIQAFEKQARQGKDAELRTFAEETLPVLQKHLSMAQKVTSGEGSAQAGGSTAASGESTKKQQ